jgi:ABC-type transporter Mla subunit MlaD
LGDPDSILSILWASDPAAQRYLWVLVGGLGLSVIAVYGPLITRLVRLHRLERRLSAVIDETSPVRARSGPRPVNQDAIRDLLSDSAIASAWSEFERRWQTAQLSETPERAPIRLADVLDDRPLLPFGPRRSLLPILPGLFVVAGIMGALLELIPSLASLSADDTPYSGQTSWLATQVSGALRCAVWGFLGSTGAALAGRLIEGGFAARAGGLDALIERAYGSVSPGELAEITRQTQQKSLETLGRDLTRFSNELNERLDRGLQRIEQSSVRSASLISQEQRSALRTIVQEISVTMRQGVEHQLAELREVLQRTIDHQNSVASGLAEAFEKMVENTKSQDRVSRSLNDSADAVETAARSMRDSAQEMQPLLEHLGNASAALSSTASHMSDTQQVMARSAEGVRSSLAIAASGAEDQRGLIELSLTEMRRTLVGLGDGLSDSLQQSLRDVDGSLGSTVGKLKETLAETNETLDRITAPVRAAEGTTRETHVALDRVRSEVEALGQWLSQAARPLRTGLEDVEGRAEDIARAISEFANHTRQIDKTMQALRDEIHEESRRLQGAGSDLGRRLTQAADAVGMLETTAADAVRRTQPQSGPGGDQARPRPSTGAPISRVGAEAAEPSRTEPDQRPSAGWQTSFVNTTAGPAPVSSPPAQPRAKSASSVEQTPVTPPAESGSKALRARGPDPYTRFESEEAEATQPAFEPNRESDPRSGSGLNLASLLGKTTDEASDEGASSKES